MLNELAAEVYQTALDHGWYDDVGEGQENLGEKIALMHSELSEALEEIRKGNTLTDVYFDENGKPEGATVELIDCIIRIFDTLARHKVDIDYAFQLKATYNKGRPYKHGGKKF